MIKYYYNKKDEARFNESRGMGGDGKLPKKRFGVIKCMVGSGVVEYTKKVVDDEKPNGTEVYTSKCKVKTCCHNTEYTVLPMTKVIFIDTMNDIKLRMLKDAYPDHKIINDIEPKPIDYKTFPGIKLLQTMDKEFLKERDGIDIDAIIAERGL